MNSKITGAFNEGITGAVTTKTLVTEEDNLEEFSHLTREMRDGSVRASVINAIYYPIIVALGSVGVALIINVEEDNLEEFSHLTREMRDGSVRASVINAIYYPIIVALGSVGVALIINVGGMDVFNGDLSYGDLVVFLSYATLFYDPIRTIANLLTRFQDAQASAERVISLINTDLSYGDLVVFLSYATLFYDPIRTIANLLTRFQDAQASAERVISLINTESDIIDRPDVIEKYGQIGNLKKENWEPIKGDIELIDVGFHYKTGEKVMEHMNLKIEAGNSIAIVGPTGSGKSTIVNLICRFYEPTSGQILGEKVMEHMNLKIEAGNSIAIVGPTGSGKSTIVNLICRFYEPTSGQILIDGVDYRERTQEWLHSHLGYVLQTPQLFSGTIKENIRYGKLDATDEEIIEAAKLVNAHEFITHYPDGYETVIGEGGSGLSTGQKQLISFARALIANPAILILDEATASIDIETEKLIQDAIQVLLKDRTSFIIAHRLSTIVNANQILLLKNGEIAEKGTHAELIAQKGNYYQLYMGQFEKIK